MLRPLQGLQDSLLEMLQPHFELLDVAGHCADRALRRIRLENVDAGPHVPICCSMLRGLSSIASLF